jgi:hypothetical protein
MKKSLGGINVLYPTPTVIVGAVVAGKPNFITIAHIGIVNHYWSLGPAVGGCWSVGKQMKK